MLSILALHENRHLTDECVQILNDEWPRSKAARLFSLSKSRNSLPYSLAVVENQSNVHVVGYCRLAKVISEPKSVLIESVVVDKKRRGQGLGRKVMEMAEQHAAGAGFHRVYLSTKDKQGFYQHLGYTFCKPVNTLGAQMLETCDCSPETNTPLPDSGDSSTGCNSCSSPAGLSCNQSLSAKGCCDSRNKDTCKQLACSETEVEKKPTESEPQGCTSTDGALPPPPPPPPPPVLPVTQPVLRTDWMMKDITHVI